MAQRAQSNGLDATVTDLGYSGTTLLASDDGTFKVPSLRNVALRAPYMHDGRFASLEEVVQHYSSGVEGSPNLGRPLFAGSQLNMTQEEQDALVAFLKTLSDETMTQDPKFGDPF